MKLINDLLSTLNLHANVKELQQGPYQTAVLTRNCGLAATPHDNGSHHSNATEYDTKHLTNIEVSGLAQMARSSNSFEAAIGMATINSLLDIDEQLCVNVNGKDILMEKGKNKSVALIGHFPFATELHQAAKRLWVIERHPQEGDVAESEIANLVPQAEVIGITGSSLINHTIDHLLALCDKEAYVVVLGATTPLSPILFDYGVDAISGTRVTDPEMVLRCVSQGTPFRQLKGIQLLTMERERR